MAFEGFEPEGLYPAASMNVGQAAHFNFGYSSFSYTPTKCGDSSFQPIVEAVKANFAEDVDSVSTSTPRRVGDSGLVQLGPREPVLTDGVLRGTEESLGDVRRANADERNPDGTLWRRTQQGPGTGDHVGIQRNRNCAENCDRQDITMSGVTEENEGRLEERRQELAENLVGMGFPVEWAIRAVERPGEYYTKK